MVSIVRSLQMPARGARLLRRFDIDFLARLDLVGDVLIYAGFIGAVTIRMPPFRFSIVCRRAWKLEARRRR